MVVLNPVLGVEGDGVVKGTEQRLFVGLTVAAQTQSIFPALVVVSRIQQLLAGLWPMSVSPHQGAQQIRRSVWQLREDTRRLVRSLWRGIAGANVFAERKSAGKAAIE